MVAPYGDVAKPALDVLGDDYTTKYMIKAKSSPKSMPVSFTIEDEVKGKGGVEGTLTAKYKEPYTGITFDKIKLKGSSLTYEASKSVEGVKFKAKGDPFDVSSTAASAELKTRTYTVTAAADKKKLGGSLSLAVWNCVVGCDASYALSGGALAYSAGLNFAMNAIFGALVVTSKKVASLALMWSPSPALAIAASVDSDKKEPVVGFKFGLVPAVTVGAKTTKDTLSLVYINKFGKDASLVLAATAKYADLNAKPAFGASLTIG